MEIKIIESSVVCPAEDTPRKRLQISSLDLLVKPIHVLTVYFFKSNACPNFFDLGKLKEGLSKVMVPYYPVAGRLDMDEEDGRLVINCNAKGALFIEAQADYVLDDFSDFTPCSDLKKFIPSVDYSSDISSYPLLLLQVTSLKCGSIILGVGLHHTVSDGTAAIRFINTWSDIVRGGSSSSVTPLIDRTILLGRVPPTPKFHHKEYIESSSKLKLDSNTKQTCTTILKLTLDQINTLRTKSTRINETNNINDGHRINFSTYEILAAHIWVCVCKSRNLPDDVTSTLYIPTDGRHRFCPPLPTTYLGNVLFTNSVSALSGDVISKPFMYTQTMIREAIKKIDDEYMRSAIDYLELQSNLATFKRDAQTFGNPNLNVTSWSRMPIHDADFGWGRPICMRPASVLFEGNIYILPSPTNDGSLSLHVCLESHHMKQFEKLLYDF